MKVKVIIFSWALFWLFTLEAIGAEGDAPTPNASLPSCVASQVDVGELSEEALRACLRDTVNSYENLLVLSQGLGQQLFEATASDSKLKQVNTEYYETFYKFHKDRMRIITQAYDYQRNSGMVILATVIALVCLGVGFSILQFRSAISEYAKARPGDIADDLKVQFEISKDKMVVNTGVIGFATIALSFLFYISYLYFVFPITYPKEGNFGSSIDENIVEPGPAS